MEVYRQNKKILLGTFFSLFLLFAIVIAFMENSAYQQERERINYITLSHVNKLQYAINVLLQKTQSLEIFVIAEEDMLSKFDKIAEKLIDSPAIRSLQLAPNGVVTYVAPLEGNEAAFGDLFSDPARAAEANYAKETGKMTLSGPFELYQGGIGLIARQPIYTKSENGEKAFWGFSIIAFDFTTALLPAQLDLLEKEGYDYKLRRIHPDTNEPQILRQSSGTPLSNPINISFDLPNTTWTFSVAPKNGWIHYKQLLLSLLAALFICALLTALEYFLLKLHRQKQQLKYLSETDALTGVANLLKMQRELRKRCADPRQQFALFFMDLNKFKAVNDTLGHAYGDLLLKACAMRLQECLKPGDILGRVGGDEFAAIVQFETSENDYEKRLSLMLKTLNQPFDLSGETVSPSISIGYAIYPRDAINLENLIKIADKAMYKMKLSFSRDEK